jgi:hypothetical protein
MTPNTNQAYFSVELGLFYYILKKKDCVFEFGPKNIDFKIKVFFGFFNYFSLISNIIENLYIKRFL